MRKESSLYNTRIYLEKNLPKSIFVKIRQMYNKLTHIIENLFSIINYVLLFPFNLYLKKKNIYLFCFRPMGIGDRMIISSVIYYYKSKGKVILISSKDDVYQNLGIEIKKIKRNFLNDLFVLFLTSSLHSNIIGAFGNFSEFSRRSLEKKIYRNSIFHKRKDVLKELQGISHDPKIIFSEEEMEKFGNKYKNLIRSSYSIIVPGSYLNGYPTIKDIGKDKMQKVVDKIKIKWVQTGTKDEPLLKNVLDLREMSIRETFFIASKAKLIVTTEGMLTQLAGAFNIPCVTICTGFIYPESSKYKSTFFVQPDPLPGCAYCWDHICKKTGNANALCAKDIKTEQIIKPIKKILKY